MSSDSGHHVAGLVRYERVAAREEALRGTHERDRTTHAAHLLGGGAGGGLPKASPLPPPRGRLWDCSRPRPFRGRRGSSRRGRAAGRPSSGPGPGTRSRGRLPGSRRSCPGAGRPARGPPLSLPPPALSSSVISSGELSTRGQPPSSRTRARTRSGNCECGLHGDEGAHGVSQQDGISRGRGGRGRGPRRRRALRQAVSRLGFVRVAAAAQVDADEPARWLQGGGPRR